MAQGLVRGIGESVPGERAHIAIDDAIGRLAPGGERSVALFEHGTLRIRMYAPRGTDPQTPHRQDELYVIARGSGVFFDGVERRPCGTGDLIFAAAGTTHRFEDFTGDFAAWVIFYGPDGGEPAG